MDRLRGQQVASAQLIADLRARVEELEWHSTRAAAELRHAYEQLVSGLVVDQRRFADGLIAPQIQRLEDIVATSATEPRNG